MNGGAGIAALTGALWPALVVGACVAFAVCLAVVLTQRWHARFTHDGTEGVQKFHDRPVPRVGGLGIAAGYLAAFPLMPGDLAAMWGLIGLAGLPALLAGLAEDVTKRVGVKARLLTTMGTGVLFALLTGYVMDKVDVPGVDWLLSFYVVALLFTGFAMGGVANAVNIVDGFNGLAAGALLIMLATFAFVGAQVGDRLVVGLALGQLALVAGFFVLNFPSGRIFLGDGGAYFCGFLLAALGVLLPARNAEISAWTAMLICGYPVIETLASIRRKARRDGHSVGQPDRVHFHMLVHRTYARRLVPRGGRISRRNPVTAALVWIAPLVTSAFVVLAWRSAALSAVLFFVAAGLYALVYRSMTLQPPRPAPRRLRRVAPGLPLARRRVAR